MRLKILKFYVISNKINKYFAKIKSIVFYLDRIGNSDDTLMWSNSIENEL